MTTTLFIPAHAREIETPSMRLFHDAAPDVVSYGGIMLADGNAGLGKTLTVTGWLREIPQEHVWLNLGKTPLGNDVLNTVAARLGVALPGGARTKIRQDIVGDALAERDLIVAVDEAHELGARGIHELRCLHDRPDATWTLLLIGTGLRHLSKATKYQHLLSRTGSIVNFLPLTLDELIELLPQYHPLYRGIDANLVADIDEIMTAHHDGPGNLRAWSLFTHTLTGVVGIDATTPQTAIEPVTADDCSVALARKYGTT